MVGSVQQAVKGDTYCHEQEEEQKDEKGTLAIALDAIRPTSNADQETPSEEFEFTGHQGQRGHSSSA
ncbi:hypothetical protein IFR05_016992, partial [Cadophora sp. M221]